MVPMGIAVVLACLTTAIGQVAAVAEFTSTVTGKVSYKKVAVACSILSALTALLGVDGIVTYVGWIFGVCYPPCLALLVLGVLVKVVPNDGAYKGSVYLVTIYALLESLPGLSGWITPFIIGFVIGAVVYKATGHDKAVVGTTGE